MTPLDFHMMTALLFEGQRIFIDRRRVVFADGIMAALGVVFPLHGGNGIRAKALWPQIVHRACVFLVYMLGQSLATNSGCSVHLWWLHYFRFFTNIEGFNWASVGLVALYHLMSMFSRGMYDSYVDCFYLWEVCNFIFRCQLPCQLLEFLES